MPEPAPDRWYAERDIATTLAKGLRVLSAFDEVTRRLTMPEIAAATGLDRATVRRLVITLADMGYLDRAGRGFVLTPRVLGHAGAYLRGNNIGSAVQPILNRYAADLDLAVSLACRDGGSAIYVASSALRDTTVSLGFTIGSRLPLLQTAIGRMVLAHGDPEFAEATVAESPLHRYTAATLTDRTAVREQIRQARAHGFALVRGEFEAGIAGLAVPVGLPGGTPPAVIGLSAPIERFQAPDRLERDVGLLQRCVAELDRTGVFGHRQGAST